MAAKQTERLAIDTARLLAVDMVERARSGHPGMPLGAAPILYLLFRRQMRHNPRNPSWPGRDRFVLSAGHASALLYSMLHLSGYDLSIEDLKGFRQLGSRTPGHPEHGLTPGVETTTGPLGQGLATAVGMAMAERRTAELINRPGFRFAGHHTYVLASDGDMMEGIGAEAASLAGHLRLGRLIVLYDSNRVTIEGPTSLAFGEDTAARYRACGWQVLEVPDGNDTRAVELALAEAKNEEKRPSLIIVRTRIGYGSPHREGTAKAHGEPLGPEETALVKEAFGFPPEESFYVPEEVREHFRPLPELGEALEAEWNDRLSEYRRHYPEEARRFEEALEGGLPEGWESALPDFSPPSELATREASRACLEALARRIPFLIGGSADLAPSCGTLLEEEEAFSARTAGASIHFGVREHAMGAVLNGLALSGPFRPYGATFLVFADYMKPAIRLAALMQLPVVYIFTHDSIALGEDGPTHQPVEQLAMLRAVPGLTLIRPSDANETKEAWKAALSARGPVALILTRQKLPVLDPARCRRENGVDAGAYVAADWEGDPSPGEGAIIVATGSELHPALGARALLEGEGIPTRVVSMPCRERFLRQPESLREQVLPAAVTCRVVVEAASPFGWEGLAGASGRIVALERFGASAPGPALLEAFGFTPEHIAGMVRELKNPHR